MDPLATNPFGILRFIVAPAILTNASSAMALSTLWLAGRPSSESRDGSCWSKDTHRDLLSKSPGMTRKGR